MVLGLLLWSRKQLWDRAEEQKEQAREIKMAHDGRKARHSQFSSSKKRKRDRITNLRSAAEEG